jgi:hypothetical protein
MTKGSASLAQTSLSRVSEAWLDETFDMPRNNFTDAFPIQSSNFQPQPWESPASLIKQNHNATDAMTRKTPRNARSNHALHEYALRWPIFRCSQFLMSQFPIKSSIAQVTGNSKPCVLCIVQPRHWQSSPHKHVSVSPPQPPSPRRG